MTVKFGDNTSEHLKGTESGDYIYALGGNDTVEGLGGADEISGDQGDDKLYGGDGDDKLWADQGNDLIDGGGDTDTLHFEGNASVTVDLSKHVANGATSGHDEVWWIENVVGTSYSDTIIGDNPNFFMSGGLNHLSGGDGNDVIRGLGGMDTLEGGGGNDTLDGGDESDVISGGDGADWMAGGHGNDHFDGGSGYDTVDYSAADWGGVKLLAGLGPWDYGAEGMDTITNVERIIGTQYSDVLDAGYADDDSVRRIDGGDGSDTITGSYNNDLLNGGYGDDVIDGGAGVDELSGGAGSDTFKFGYSGNWTGAGYRDIVADFEHGVDRIDLSAAHTGPDQVTFSHDAYNNTILHVHSYDFAGHDFEVQFKGPVTVTTGDMIFG